MTLPGLVLAQRPYIPPAPDYTPGWDGLVLEWIYDDVVWSLSNPRDGIIMKPGIEGLLMPPIKHYREDSPAVNGAYWTGFTVDPRTVAWPIRLFHDGSTAEWIDYNEAFTKALNPAREGTFRVRSVRTVRTMKMRYQSGMDAALQRDPTFFGWVDYDIRFQADRPMWAGPEVVRSWAAAAAADFFTGDPANPIYISPSATLDTAVMPNPGDIEAWPVWTLEGPITVTGGPTKLGVAGRDLLIPFDISTGEKLVIDTRPDAQTAILYPVAGPPVDKTEDLGSWAFTPIEAGDEVPLTLEMSGNGSVSCALEPLHYKAF